jgi:hypothetical protein
VEDDVSAQRYGGEAAAQQAERENHPRGKGERGEGVEDRKEGTMEENEERQALYPPFYRKMTKIIIGRGPQCQENLRSMQTNRKPVWKP